MTSRTLRTRTGLRVGAVAVGGAAMVLGVGSAEAALPTDGRYDVAVLTIPTPDAAFWQSSNLNTSMQNAPGIAPWTLSHVQTGSLTLPSALAPYDVVVVSGSDRSWINIATTTVISNFVQNGGVLVVSPVNPTTSGTDSLLSAFGTSYSLQYGTTGSPTTGCVGPGTAWPSKNLKNYDQTSPLVFNPNIVSSVFTDCDFVRPFNLGSAYKVIVTVDNYLRFQSAPQTQVELAHATFGEGEIVVTSAAFSLNTPQHKRLAENFIWLAKVQAPDTTPPDVTFVQPPPVTSNPVLDIRAQASDAGGLLRAIVLQNGQLVPSTLDPAGNVSATLTLVEGTNNLVIRAVDVAGNTTNVPATIFLDTAAPYVALDPVPTFTASPTFTSSGSVIDVGSGLASASFYVNGTLSSVVSPAPDGTASAALGLVEGSNTVELRAVDLAGNTASVQSVLTLDTLPPDVRLLNIPAITASADLVVLGTVGDTNGITSARLLVDGVDLGSLALDPSGDVSLPVQLSEGPHSLVLEATDSAGNRGAQAVDVLVDTTAPTLTILSPAADQVLGSSTLDVSVRVDDATATVVLIDGQPFDVPAGGGVVTATLALPAEGLNDIVVAATDEAGNSSNGSTSVTLDLTAPLVTIDVNDGAAYGPLAADLLPLTLVIDDATATTVTVGGASFSLAGGGGVVYATLPLTEGDNALSVVVTDAAGISTTLARSVAYDTIAPSGSLLLPAYARGVVDLSATATDLGTGVTQVAFSVDGGVSIAGTRASSGAWTTSYDASGLSDGPHSVTATFIDAVGNASTQTGTVIVDQTAPSLSLLTPSAGAFVGGSVTISASGSDGTSGLSRLDLAVGGLTVASCSASPCTVAFDTTTLPDGPFRVTATALDRAGNAAAPFQIDVTSDNSAPSRFLQSPTTGSIVGSSMTVSVAVVDASFANVQCFVGTTSLGVSTNPSFSATVSTLAFQDGALSVRCVATDSAGNVGSDSATVTVKNASLVLNPRTLNLKSKGGSTSITLDFEAKNAALYVPSASVGWALLPPGGSAIAATPSAGADSLVDSDKDGIPELTLKFDRSALIASIQAGISSGAINASQPVSVSLVAGGRVIGSDAIVIK